MPTLLPIKAHKKIVFCKVETTYGTDAVPVAATDAMLVHNFSCIPLEDLHVDRNPAMPFFGNSGQIKVGEYMSMEYDIEATGSGTVAGAPAYAPPLRGCAFSESLTPITGPTIYSLITSAEESVTKYFYWDGELHKMLGAKGTSELKVSKGETIKIHTTWTGLYGGISAVSMPVPDLSRFPKPLPVNKVNTTFSVHGYAAVLHALTLTQGNVQAYKNAPNAERIDYTGRSSKGTLTIEATRIADKDFVAICRVEPPVLGAIALVQGVTAGSKFLFDATYTRLKKPRYSEDGGIGLLSMEFDAQYSTAGNDEFTYKTQ